MYRSKILHDMPKHVALDHHLKLLREAGDNRYPSSFASTMAIAFWWSGEGNRWP